MRNKLAALTMLTLTSCGYGYTLDKEGLNPCSNFRTTGEVAALLNAAKVARGECATKIVWYCKFRTPLFFFDNYKAACETKEECSKICLGLSK